MATQQSVALIINKAHTIAAELTAFYAASVGQPINTNEEFSIHC